ncbi:inositol-phosphate phosphatase [Duganella dendranthematis]|uniref:Inositol-phosphate phosphatase n=1 Tax=Duganella dendranthematis TaxID=2728021 RepID=A0ABX6MDD3_9BURK|nr:inositol monophosphatase family protein [Duganella dendranthematis]QJD92350.1 inositol-phosphate phosphatase [Duganella dendranthematis]
MTAIDTEGVLQLVREVGADLCATFWRSAPLVDMDAVWTANETLRQALAAQYPPIAWADGHLSEAYAQRGEYWIGDAIDGALQFLRAIPLWCMSLTLMREGVPVFTVVYDALHDEMFHALWGHGAWYNGQPIRVRARQQQELVATRNLAPTSLQLAYVACGRLDAFWQDGADGYLSIGGTLLIQEAGGVATQADGRPYRLTSPSIVAAPPVLHASMLQRLQDRKAA